METEIKKQNFKNENLQVIKILTEGERFKSYIGWSFSRKLECKKYLQGINYSINQEIRKIESILDKQQVLEPGLKGRIKNELDEYKNKVKNSLTIYPKSTSESESKSDKTDSQSSDKKSNLETNININNKNNINNNENKNDKKISSNMNNDNFENIEKKII